MKGWTVGFCVLCGSLMANDQQTVGTFGYVGAGFAPLYVEEVVNNNRLTAGATVRPIHINAQYGYFFNPDLAIFASTAQNTYVDANGNIYFSGVTGAGLLFSPDDFFNTTVRLSGGYAGKTILGDLDSSSGLGFNLGLHRWFGTQWALDVSYSYMALDTVTSIFATGEQEAVSAIQLGVAYQWQ